MQNRCPRVGPGLGARSPINTSTDDYRLLRPDWWTESDGLPLGLAHSVTLPGERVGVVCWRPESHTANASLPAGQAVAAALLRKGCRATVRARADQGRGDPSQESGDAELTLDRGDALTLLVPGGADLTIRTATHTASIVLVVDTWVCLSLGLAHIAGSARAPRQQVHVLSSRSVAQVWALRAIRVGGAALFYHK